MDLTPSGHAAFVVSIILPLLAILLVGLRFYAIWLKKSAPKVDDYIIVLSLLCAIGACAISLHAYDVGIWGAKSRTRPTLPMFRKLRQMQLGHMLLTFLSFALTKVAVVLLYKRVFTIRWFKITINVMLAAVSAWTVGTFLSMLFSGKNVSGFWSTLPGRENDAMVLEFYVLVIATAALDFVFDVLIMGLPLFVIRGLHMDTKKKIYLSGIFLLGAFCLVACGIRLSIVQRLSNADRNSTSRDPGLVDRNSMWAIIEACASIMTACLPTLGPIFGGVEAINRGVKRVQSILSSGNKAPTSDVNGQASKASRSSAWNPLQKASEPKGHHWVELNERPNDKGIVRTTEIEVRRDNQSRV